MAGVIEDWLTSFAYSDWGSMGNLRLHATRQKQCQASVKSFSRRKARRLLEAHLNDSASLHARLQNRQAQPQARLFLLTLNGIRQMKIETMSHNLRKHA